MADLKYTVGIDTSGAQKALSNLKTALVAVGAAVVTREIIQVTARFEDLRSTLDVVTGSAAKGSQAFKFIQDFALKTQFGVEDLTKTFIQLKANGIEPTEKLLTTFADAAAVTTDQLGSLQAITDLMTRTTQGGLQLPDIERLGERGIPVLKILQEELDLSRGEITEFGKSAAGANTIIQTLFDSIDRDFGGLAGKRAQNLSGLISNLKIAITNLAAEFGAGLAPAIKQITQDLTNFVNSSEGVVGTIGEGIGKAILKVRDGIASLAEQTGLLTPGGLEEFAANVTAVLANFIEGFGRSIDSIVNTLNKAMDGLKKLLAAVSKIPFSGFDAIFLPAGQSITDYKEQLQKDLDEAQQRFDEFGFGLAGQALYMDLEALKDQMKALKEGELVLLEATKNTFTGASEAVSPFVESLRESAEELREQAAAAADGSGELKDYNQHVIDYTNAQAKANEIAAKAKTLQDALNQSVAAYNEAATKRQSAADTSAELSNFEGIKRTLEEIRLEENRLAEAARERIEEQFKDADPAILAQQLAGIEAVKNATITARQEAARVIESNAARRKKEDEDAAKGPQTFAEGWKDAFDSYYENANDAAQRAQDSFKTATKGMEDAIVDFVKTGKLSFRDLISDILEQSLRANLRQIFSGILNPSSGSGGGIQDLFGGFFAKGGYLPAGQFGVVGERGPEIINGPANITPLSMGGGGSNVTYNISAVDAMSFKQMIARDPQFIHAVATKGSQGIPVRR